MTVFDDQKAQMQARLQAVNDQIAAKQAELATLQTVKQQIQQDFADLKSAYQAWKGTPL